MNNDTPRRYRFFFGWVVVAGTFVAQFFVAGLFTYSVSLLIAPVRETFDTSLEQVMYSLTLATVFGLFVQPLAGVLIDHFAARWLMAAGTVLFAFGLYALARSTSITQYIVIFALTMSLANSFAGSLSSAAVISRWFSASRGRALGIAAIGTSAGGILIPPLMNAWIGLDGWRSALDNLALAVLLLMLPVVILCVRGRPEDVSLQAEATSHGDTAAQDDAPALSLGALVGDHRFWCISLSLGLLFGAFGAVLANITPYATNLGHSNEQASSLIMAIAAAGFVGKLIFGFAADKFSLKAGLWAAQCLVISALLLFSLEPDYTLMLAGATLMGLAAGGMLPVWGAMTAQAFGLKSFGSAMGFMSPVVTLCIMPCYPLMGRLFDMTGDYRLSLYVFAGITLTGAVILLPLRLQR